VPGQGQSAVQEHPLRHAGARLTYKVAPSLELNVKYFAGSVDGPWKNATFSTKNPSSVPIP
jgi:hypothetical protein